MAIKINISGTNISGDSKVLNGIKITGKSNTDISVKESSIEGEAEVLNNVDIKGDSSVDIEMESVDITENARVLNNLDVKNGEASVQLKGIRLGEDVEFMNGKKFSKDTTSNKEEASHQESKGEETISKTGRKDGFFTRVMKRFQKQEDEQTQETVTYEQKSHKDFENELSRGGKLRTSNDTRDKKAIGRVITKSNQDREI